MLVAFIITQFAFYTLLLYFYRGLKKIDTELENINVRLTMCEKRFGHFDRSLEMLASRSKTKEK